jgi:hypothetical protein
VIGGRSFRVVGDGQFRWLSYRGEWCATFERRLARGDLDGVAGRTREPDGLAYLERFPGLRFVSLIAEDAAALAPVAALERLESLHVGIVRPSKSPVPFPQFSHLRKLVTEGSPALSGLLANASIVELLIERPPTSDLRFLAGLPELESLTLGSSRRMTSLAGIEQLVKLRELELNSLTALESLEGVQLLPDLVRLEVEACKRVSDLAPVGGCVGLTSLGLMNCGEIASLAPLVSLRRLEKFFAWESTRVMDGDLSPLLALPELGVVAMQSRREYRPSVAEVEAELVARGHPAA